MPVTSLGLGVFDGMHLGHQQILKQADTLLTFSPHPDLVLNKASHLHYLTTTEELAYYVPKLLVFPFTLEIAKLAPEDFLQNVIQHQFKPSRFVVGYDFVFGRKKAGDATVLKAWAKKRGLDVVVVEAECVDGEPVKSSVIRQLIQEDFDAAVRYLGHSYLIMGTVVKGDNRGKALGFPTANIQVDPLKLLPKSGVYKGHVKVKGMLLPAAINIGDNPTFGQQQKHVEAHILGFDEDIYGEMIYVFVEGFLREEMKFESKEDLVAQIREDVTKI